MICKQCDKPFESIYVVQKFCSAYCRKQFHDYKPRDLTVKKCIVCSSEFQTKAVNRKYCSRSCSWKTPEAKERNRLRHYYLDGKGVTKECTCHTCNSTFTTNHKRKYCTPKCSPKYKEPFTNKDIRTCESCNTQYLPAYRAQRFCSRKCRKHGYVGYKNSERAYYNSKEWKLIRATFIQGHTIVNGIQLSNKYCIKCYIQQNRLNDMYAVDHVVPRRQGGSDEFGNLQSLCRYHHQSKSAAEGNSIQIGLAAIKAFLVFLQAEDW